MSFALERAQGQAGPQDKNSSRSEEEEEEEEGKREKLQRRALLESSSFFVGGGLPGQRSFFFSFSSLVRVRRVDPAGPRILVFKLKKKEKVLASAWPLGGEKLATHGKLNQSMGAPLARQGGRRQQQQGRRR